MSEEDKQDLLDRISSANQSVLTGGTVASFRKAFNARGFASYQLMLIVVSAVVKGTIGRGPPFVANPALAGAMGIAAGPVGWALTAVFTLFKLAGPSRKVTVPSVAYVAMLRKSQDTLHCAKCGAAVDGGFRFCPECGQEIATTA